MASKNNYNKKNISKKKQPVENNTNTNKKNNNANEVIMKVLVFLGVLILFFIIVYLMYYFFVSKSDIEINISTDKKMEYITLEGEEELIMTQKYVSDLAYSMRYDVNNFKVFKYKQKDIFKFLNDERVLVAVEKSSLPQNCSEVTSENDYYNCYVILDNYTEEYYISQSNATYKITIKSPNTSEYQEGVRTRIDYMLETFTMN